MDTYSFPVCAAEEIDLRRIVDENNGADTILVISGNALLMLSTEFLSKFQRDDNLFVDTQLLSRVWGSTKVSVLYSDNAAWFKTGSYEANIEVPGYRCLAVEKYRLSVVKKQVKAAQGFERKFFVHVKVL